VTRADAAAPNATAPNGADSGGSDGSDDLDRALAFLDADRSRERIVALGYRIGAVVGLLTATDALEAVMGELEDPLDRESTAK